MTVERAGQAGQHRTVRGTPTPIFSSSVIWATRHRARSPDVPVLHGVSGGVADTGGGSGGVGIRVDGEWSSGLPPHTVAARAVSAGAADRSGQHGSSSAEHVAVFEFRCAAAAMDASPAARNRPMVSMCCKSNSGIPRLECADNTRTRACWLGLGVGLGDSGMATAVFKEQSAAPGL